MMTVIAYLFSILQTVKDVVTQMSKKSSFRRPFDKQQSETLLKYVQQHLYHFYWSLWSKLSWKKPPLVTCKILGHFVNTLTADGKYSLLNTGNLTQAIKIQLSKKQ